MLRCDIVDVFSIVPGQGNPVAVVHDADGMDADRMQKLASWIGLPETAFVMRPSSPDNDYAVRIFAPSCELPFAGHPSIGTLAALRSARPEWNGKTTFVQECKAGLVALDVTQLDGEDVINVQTPQGADVRHLDEVETLAFGDALGLSAKPASAKYVSAGAKWIILGYDKAPDVLEAQPNQEAILALSHKHDTSGVTIFAPSPNGGADYVVRSFAPRIGVAEDAACGGGNACVAAALAHTTGASVRHTASQGQKLGRNAMIFAAGPYDDRRFRIGGNTRIVMSGALNLE